MRSPNVPLTIVLSLSATLGACAPTNDDAPEFDQTASEIIARTCPEAVTLDDRGDPRNAAGHIRNCWPGEPRCYCDRDDDCYRATRYVACPLAAARVSGPPTTGARDAGDRHDTGPRDAGVREGTTPARATPGAASDTGPRDAGRGPATPSRPRRRPPRGPPRVWGATPPASIPTFPGAEGFGARASGGRGREGDHRDQPQRRGRRLAAGGARPGRPAHDRVRGVRV